MKRVTSLLINNIISRIFAISIKDFYYYPVILYHKAVKKDNKKYIKKKTKQHGSLTTLSHV